MNKIGFLLLLLFCFCTLGCSTLQVGKDFPREKRQDLVDRFAYFEQNGFGGYYRLHDKIEITKAKWRGKVLPLFLSNMPAEYPAVPKEFLEFPEDWKPKNLEEVDTLVLLEFRGGVQEKLLNEKPKKLKLIMTIIDVKKEKVVRKVKLKTWEPGADRQEILKNLPPIKESLEKKRKS